MWRELVFGTVHVRQGPDALVGMDYQSSQGDTSSSSVTAQEVGSLFLSLGKGVE